MKTRIKLLGLVFMVAIPLVILSIGQLMAHPATQAAGTVTLSGGFERPDLERFYSDKTGSCAGGCNIVSVRVTDADLSPTRTGRVAYIGIDFAATPNPLFTILSGDGVSTGAGVAGVLQGETDATRRFTGDGSSVVFPLTNVALTAASIVNFNANLTSGGVSVLAFGRTAIDRNGADGLTPADVYTGSSATNSVNAIVHTASSRLTTTADSATILSLAFNSADSVTIAAAAGGTIRIDLSAKPVDRDGDFVFTATGDIVSVTVISGDGTPMSFAITGDAPGVGSGGAIIVNIHPFAACGIACVTVTTTYLVYSPNLVAATTLTMASPP